MNIYPNLAMPSLYCEHNPAVFSGEVREILKKVKLLAEQHIRNQPNNAHSHANEQSEKKRGHEDRDNSINFNVSPLSLVIDNSMHGLFINSNNSTVQQTIQAQPAQAAQAQPKSQKELEEEEKARAKKAKEDAENAQRDMLFRTVVVIGAAAGSVALACYYGLNSGDQAQTKSDVDTLKNHIYHLQSLKEANVEDASHSLWKNIHDVTEKAVELLALVKERQTHRKRCLQGGAAGTGTAAVGAFFNSRKVVGLGCLVVAGSGLSYLYRKHFETNYNPVKDKAIEIQRLLKKINATRLPIGVETPPAYNSIYPILN